VFSEQENWQCEQKIIKQIKIGFFLHFPVASKKTLL
jgi:hypothetical protein